MLTQYKSSVLALEFPVAVSNEDLKGEENGTQLLNFHIFHYYFWSFVIATQCSLQDKIHLKPCASLNLRTYDFWF